MNVNDELTLVRTLELKRDYDRSGAGELDGIREEIEQDLLHSKRVSNQGTWWVRSRWRSENELDVLPLANRRNGVEL